VENVTYEYEIGSAPYVWLEEAIDDARDEDIPWVIVGLHKNCISVGDKSCEAGPDVMNLLHEKRVDLILQGHDHNYQRTKQLAHGPGCPSVPIEAFDGDCVADGSDEDYEKGAGSVTVIAGQFGHCCYPVSSSDPEAGYFAAMDDTSDGYAEFTVSREQISGVSVPSTGSYADAFTISGSSDDDGDGFSMASEQHVGTSAADPCGDHLHPGGVSMSWPIDLVSGGIPESTNRVTLTDLLSFVAPVRRFHTSPPAPGYDVRWDLVPGSGVFQHSLNIQDITELATNTPPMFGGPRAFNGPTCTG
jgi:hypothetical protein